ncbi:helix-turn-helix domain-containing protein [Aquimarina brevivitae]|uniref:Helix-turn-helix protein n=1 Tax=Aquimarina brevivitae TaxID=323412 RepID=A0A4Q7P0U7_9FLAO|nr:helix-turn-helix domain-containing protein [Aquimarina brevivitae]RZS93426.1 helix-turn-helix protein [Aquimarina brevivitae]
MEFDIVAEQPDEELKDYIKETYRLRFKGLQEDQYRIVVDDGCYDFVFFKERKSIMKYADDQLAPISSKTFTIHQLAPPYKLNFGQQLTFYTAKVQPWWNRTFFDLPTSAGIYDLAPIYGKPIEIAHQKIFEAKKFEEQNEHFKAFIVKHLPHKTATVNLVENICNHIYNCKGITTVNELSAIFDINRQQLNAVFKTEVMYTLKRFIAIVRIVEAIRYKIKNPKLSFTELAIASGYFDQAHFNNDFKKACGTTPSKLFKDLPEFFFRHQ